MPSEESLYPRDWFKIGEKDLKRAENLLGLDDFEGAGVYVQQAIEKYFKGYLLSKGWKLRRIHNLETLLNEIIVYDASFEEFRETCQKITSYYMEERYPFIVTSELTDDEIKKSLETAKKIIERVIELAK